jgi:hypothetical protein
LNGSSRFTVKNPDITPIHAGSAPAAHIID